MSLSMARTIQGIIGYRASRGRHVRPLSVLLQYSNLVVGRGEESFRMITGEGNTR